jgi:hypothetical protein
MTGRLPLLLRTVSNPIRGERRFYSSAPLCRCGGAAACLTGKPRKPNETEGRSRVSPRRCRPSFRLPFSHARLAGRSYLRHRGSQSNPIGERIPSALIVWHALWRPALALPSDGHGESAKAARLDWQRRSGRRRLLTENQPIAWVQGFAVYAANLFIGSAGTWICGTPGRIRMQCGIVLASWLGSFGTHRIVREHSCVGSKGGAAAKQADGYGKALRLTTAFRFFGYGANIEICIGRSCSTFGGCQTFKSLIATSMQQNAPSRRGTDEPHVKLN